MLPSRGNDPHRVRFVWDVRWAAVGKLMVGLLLLSIIGSVMEQVRDIAVWLGAAAFLAVALNPLVTRLEPRLGRTAAVLVVFAGFVIGLVLVVASLVLPFATQVDELSKELPNSIQDATRHGFVADLNDRFDLVDRARQHAGEIPGYAFGAADTVLTGVVATTTILFLTAFLLFELPAIGQLILRQLPPEKRPRAIQIAGHVNHNVGGYVAGNLVISVICGTCTLIALLVLGVPYSLAFAVFMAVFDIIPLVGATVGSIVVTLAALLLAGTTEGIAMFIFVNVYQQIENHVLQPVIYRRTVQLSSLVVLIAVLCGGAVLGIVGALVAIPLAGIIQTIARDLLEERAQRLEAEASDATPERRQRPLERDDELVTADRPQ
jgi:predicted PurR-regulated permease PerM